MSAHQTATVHVRGHDFTVDYLPNAGALPTIIRLWLQEYPDDVLKIVDINTLMLIRMECQKRQAENEQYIARAIEMERLES
jgi:hypothetical protein